MAINKTQKSAMISSLKDSLSAAQCVVVVHYRGMSGKQLYDLRVSLKSKGCGMKIAKNTLTNLAIQGTEFEPVASHLKGPTAILYSKDPVALAKIIADTKKEIEHLQVKVGYLDKALIHDKDITNLAKLGSFEEVRASFLGLLVSVQSNFARLLQAPQAGFATLKQE